MTVTAPGFASWEVKDVELLVGQSLDLNVGLQVASSTIQVHVTSEAPVVENTKTDVSQVIGETQIRVLPINGRRVDSFVLRRWEITR